MPKPLLRCPWADGSAAYVDYQPLVNAEKLYRSARWGRHLEIFFLDTRSYRQANLDPDAGAYPKTMLGDEQRRWLIDGLVRSKATWKVIVSSVPLSIPTGGDGWADGGTRQGFERELVAMFTGLRAVQVRNLVWLTTDVHFATGFRSTPFPGFRLLELTSGPLSAGFFPRQDLDPTLHPERLYFHGPETPPASFDEARGYFNFGELEVHPVFALPGTPEILPLKAENHIANKRGSANAMPRTMSTRSKGIKPITPRLPVRSQTWPSTGTVWSAMVPDRLT